MVLCQSVHEERIAFGVSEEDYGEGGRTAGRVGVAGVLVCAWECVDFGATWGVAVKCDGYGYYGEWEGTDGELSWEVCYSGTSWGGWSGEDEDFTR